METPKPKYCRDHQFLGPCPRCLEAETAAAPTRETGADSSPLTGSAADWERRYRELETVHEVFASSVRKALCMECPATLSTILDVLIATKRNSDAYMESKYGPYGAPSQPTNEKVSDSGRERA